jgi:hypothetical protein
MDYIWRLFQSPIKDKALSSTQSTEGQEGAGRKGSHLRRIQV